jgi:ATP-dependent protease HslVU (ClpYQ) peptidase subunit
MTTIAWDGRYLAADSQTTNGDMISSLKTKKIIKLRKINGKDIMCAFAGAVCDIDALIDYVVSGKNIDTELEANLITIEDGVAYLHGRCEKEYWKTKCESDDHIGSGRRYAAAAIDCGKNAMESIQIAINRDIRSGGNVTFYDTEEPEKGIQVYSD